MNVYGRSVALAFVGSLLWAACGSDSSSGDDRLALCKQGCEKTNACFADSGFPATNCDNQCAQRDSDGGGSTCTNDAEITAAYKACLDKPCDMFISCIQQIPGCKGGNTTTTGTGGSGGSGGSGGAGGGGTGGGGADGGGATCAQLLACCNAASTDMLRMQCRMIYDAASPSGDMACGLIYPSAKSTYCP